MTRLPIVITNQAWKKMIQVLNNTKKDAFLFSATGGGCNGFNYNLKAVEKIDIEKMIDKKFAPPVYERDKYKLVIDPMSEMLLMGTTIDYVKEDEHLKDVYIKMIQSVMGDVDDDKCLAEISKHAIIPKDEI